MEQEKKSVVIPIAVAVVIGIVFQASFVGVESKDTPNRAVIEFAKAYFELDPAMAERLCDEMKTIDETDTVDEYIYRVTREARDRGLGQNYMKSHLYHIDTHTLITTGDSAQIRLTGTTRKSIHSAYAVVAKIFQIGAEHEVDYTFTVVKEDGKWKVCNNPLTLSI